MVSCHPKSLPLGIRVIVILFISLNFGNVVLQESQENAPSKPNLAEAVQILTLFEMKISNDPANVTQDVKDKWSAVWTKTDGTAILMKVMNELMANEGKLSEETHKLIYEIDKDVKALPHLKTMDPFLGILHGKYLMWYKIKDKFGGQIVKFKREILDMDPRNDTLEAIYDDLKSREIEFSVALSGCENAVTEYGQKWKDSKTQPGEKDQKLVLDEVRNVGNTVRERLIDTPLSLVFGWKMSASGSDGSLDISDQAALVASNSIWSWKVVLAVVQSLLVLLVAAALLLVCLKKTPKNPINVGSGTAVGGLKKVRATSKSGLKTSKSAMTTTTKDSSKRSGLSTSQSSTTATSQSSSRPIGYSLSTTKVPTTTFESKKIPKNPASVGNGAAICGLKKSRATQSDHKTSKSTLTTTTTTKGSSKGPVQQ